MSADAMIICKEDPELAHFIDETSGGEPWSEFGKWFVQRYCGAPGFLETMAGDTEHNFIKLENADYQGIKVALQEMKTHEHLNKEKFLEYIKSHIGKHISTENW